MEHESFESESVAAIMNKNFVNIKGILSTFDQLEVRLSNCDL